MKRFRLSRGFVAVFITGVMIILIFSVALAATAVDTFNVDNQSSSVDATACTSVAGGTDMTGGARDIQVFRTAGAGTVVTDVNISVPGSLAFAIGPSTRGTALIQWDGNDGSCTLDAATGLGGISLNPDDGLTLFVSQVDLNAIVELRVYTTAANYSTYSYTIPNSISSPGYTIYFPFDQFTDFGAGANFASVNAIELFIDGTTIDSLDMTIDFVNSDFTRDFGDLPAAYNNTQTVDNGARHMPGGVYFGTGVDTEADGQEDATATGDNLNGNDETGVTAVTGSNWGDGGGQITANVTKPASVTTACVVGFIDWDSSNSFDAGGTTGGVSELVVNAWSISGSTINITTPTAAQYGGTYPATLNARFRVFAPNADLFTTLGLSTDALGCVTASAGNSEAALMGLVFGDAREGEVEDYQWGFSPTAVNLQTVTANDQSALFPLALGAFLMVLFSAGFVYNRKRQVAK